MQYFNGIYTRFDAICGVFSESFNSHILVSILLVCFQKRLRILLAILAHQLAHAGFIELQ